MTVNREGFSKRVIADHDRHTSGTHVDLAVKANGFPHMSCRVLPDLTVKVINRKEWIPSGAGGSGTRLVMDKDFQFHEVLRLG